jgi:hypothetical protein
MKHRLPCGRLLFFVLLLAILTGFVGRVAASDDAGLAQEVRSLFAAYQAGDFVYLVDRMYPPIVQASGGREQLLEEVGQIMASPQVQAVRYVSFDVLEPRLVAATDVRVYFAIPFDALVQVDGLWVRARGYQLAIREAAGDRWWFMDGEGVEPPVLEHFFPDLGRDVEFPEVSHEVVGR